MTTGEKVEGVVIVLALIVAIYSAFSHGPAPTPSPSPAPAPAPAVLVDTLTKLDTVTKTIIAYADTATAKADTSLAQAAILDDLARVLADSGRWQDAYVKEKARGDTLRVAVDSLRGALGVVSDNRDAWHRRADSLSAFAASKSHDLDSLRSIHSTRLHIGPCVAYGATVSHSGLGHAAVIGTCGSYALW